MKKAPKNIKYLEVLNVSWQKYASVPQTLLSEHIHLPNWLSLLVLCRTGRY